MDDDTRASADTFESSEAQQRKRVKLQETQAYRDVQLEELEDLRKRRDDAVDLVAAKICENYPNGQVTRAIWNALSVPVLLALVWLHAFAIANWPEMHTAYTHAAILSAAVLDVLFVASVLASIISGHQDDWSRLGARLAIARIQWLNTEDEVVKDVVDEAARKRIDSMAKYYSNKAWREDD